MKQHYKTFLRLMTIGLALGLFSCKDDPTPAEKWYNLTKNEILKQSDLKADSIISTYNEDSTFKRDHFYFDGKEFLMKGFNKGVLRVEVHYNKDKSFELRREICDNGVSVFEGIFYKGSAYGLTNMRYCNNKLREQGVRFNGERVDIWKEWDSDGKIIRVSQYRHLSNLEEMPAIKEE